jgi:DNA-binding transcriptional regulator YdaS (Cro superfamily)
MSRELERGIGLIIKAAGGHRKLGRMLGVSYQSISQWKRIPADRLVEIEIITGVTREEMRPDLFRGFTRKRTKQRTHNAT